MLAPSHDQRAHAHFVDAYAQPDYVVGPRARCEFHGPPPRTRGNGQRPRAHAEARQAGPRRDAPRRREHADARGDLEFRRSRAPCRRSGARAREKHSREHAEARQRPPPCVDAAGVPPDGHTPPCCRDDHHLSLGVPRRYPLVAKKTPGTRSKSPALCGKFLPTVRKFAYGTSGRTRRLAAVNSSSVSAPLESSAASRSSWSTAGAERSRRPFSLAKVLNPACRPVAAIDAREACDHRGVLVI